MPPNERPVLCVSIHDVAPATWPECLHLLHALQAVADIPLSWLVVPRYHGADSVSRPFERQLGELAAQGHELVLHGYTHRDDAPLGGWRSRVLRTMVTEREGEFAALDRDQARRRIELGLHWFRQRGWPVAGFVAPAWLMSAGTHAALAEYPFAYTTTWTRFLLLRPQQSVLAPSLVYAARNGAGRRRSAPAASLLAGLCRRAALVRLGLHPRDAHYPALVRHAQGLVERLLEQRDGVTKLGFAQRLAARATSTDPNTRPSGPGHIPPTSDGRGVPPPP